MNGHTSNICTKANRALAFLRCNLAYERLVRPALEYAGPFWGPSCKTPGRVRRKSAEPNSFVPGIQLSK